MVFRRTGYAWALTKKGANFGGPPVEVDETLCRRESAPTCLSSDARRWPRWGRGTVGKAIVAGVKDRKTRKVRASTVSGTDKETLHGFVADNVAPGATIYSDEASVYKSLPNPHASVNHSALEYVRGNVHINGVEFLLVNNQARVQRHVPQAEPQAS